MVVRSSHWKFAGNIEDILSAFEKDRIKWAKPHGPDPKVQPPLTCPLAQLQ